MKDAHTPSTIDLLSENPSLCSTALSFLFFSLLLLKQFGSVYSGKAIQRGFFVATEGTNNSPEAKNRVQNWALLVNHSLSFWSITVMKTGDCLLLLRVDSFPYIHVITQIKCGSHHLLPVHNWGCSLVTPPSNGSHIRRRKVPWSFFYLLFPTLSCACLCTLFGGLCALQIPVHLLKLYCKRATQGWCMCILTKCHYMLYITEDGGIDASLSLRRLPPARCENTCIQMGPAQEKARTTQL